MSVRAREEGREGGGTGSLKRKEKFLLHINLGGSSQSTFFTAENKAGSRPTSYRFVRTSKITYIVRNSCASFPFGESRLKTRNAELPQFGKSSHPTEDRGRERARECGSLIRRLRSRYNGTMASFVIVIRIWSLSKEELWRLSGLNFHFLFTADRAAKKIERKKGRNVKNLFVCHTALPRSTGS